MFLCSMGSDWDLRDTVDGRMFRSWLEDKDVPSYVPLACVKGYLAEKARCIEVLDRGDKRWRRDAKGESLYGFDDVFCGREVNGHPSNWLSLPLGLFLRDLVMFTEFEVTLMVGADKRGVLQLDAKEEEGVVRAWCGFVKYDELLFDGYWGEFEGVVSGMVALPEIVRLQRAV